MATVMAVVMVTVTPPQLGGGYRVAVTVVVGASSDQCDGVGVGLDWN